VLQVHNSAISPGGADFVVENERALLEAAGIEVRQYFVKNAEAQGMSKVRAAGKSIWNFDVARDLRTLLVEFRPDIVHVHTPFPLMSPVVFRVASQLGFPTVATMHSFRYSCVKATLFRNGEICETCVGRRVKTPAVRHRCYHGSIAGSSALVSSLGVHRMLHTFTRDVTLYVTVTQFARSKLIQEGISPGRVVVKFNSVPRDESIEGDRQESYLFVGRLEREKGVETLLDAWRRLDRPPRLVVLGDGSLRPLVEDAVRRGLPIEFRGWVGLDEVRRMVSRSKFVVLPSEWYEAGPPLVALEALAARTPIIASRIDNFADWIESGVNGFTFPSGDVDAFASVVESSLRSTSDVARYSAMQCAAGAAYSANFSQEANQRALIDLYEKARGDDRLATTACF
jgi:glycosyltransferase involved in cell wall biosynthesis